MFWSSINMAREKRQLFYLFNGGINKWKFTERNQKRRALLIVVVLEEDGEVEVEAEEFFSATIGLCSWELIKSSDTMMKVQSSTLQSES